MLAALHAIAALLDAQKPLSKVLAPYQKYAMSGELNTKVKNQESAIAMVKGHFQENLEVVDFDHLDGLTITSNTWWLNLRPSNTEPLLRLNVEAETDRAVQSLVAEVLDILKKQ
jgi:phosphomannomutase